MKELTASENLEGLFTSGASFAADARLMMAFSLAVKKGFSLASAEICVVFPILLSSSEA